MNEEFSVRQINAIRVVIKIGCYASISAALFVIILFWFFKENRSINLELVIWFSIADILFCSALLLPYDPENETFWCPLQSFLSNTFQTCMLLWTCIIGYCCLISVIKKNHLEKYKWNYRLIFVGICFLLPMLLSSIILFTNAHGDSGGFCWLDLYTIDRRRFISKLVMFYYCVMWFLLILNSFFIVKVILIVKEYSTKVKSLNKIHTYMNWYPIVTVACKLPGTANRLYTMLSKNSHPFVLTLMQSICDTFDGCCILVIFLASPEIKHSIRIVFSKIFFNNERRNTFDTSLHRQDSDWFSITRHSKFLSSQSHNDTVSTSLKLNEV